MNCQTEVLGKYCHVCGQENIEPRETIWHLITHFSKDITHFDGKFFGSLKLLILHPGFLSKEYMVGRRASYLNPITMYLFTSSIFFLIFFSLYKIENPAFQDAIKVNYKPIDEINKMDSLSFNAFTKQFN